MTSPATADLLLEHCCVQAIPSELTDRSTGTRTMPVSQAHLDEINEATRAIGDAQKLLDERIAALAAKVEMAGTHMADGDIHSLTGQSVPVVIKQNGKAEYRLIPAGSV